MQTRALQLDSRDNLIIALSDLRAGEEATVSGEKYILVTDVPAKHKFAAKDFAVGDHVIMYGVVVGKAVVPIRRGEIITTRNVRYDAATFDAHREPHKWIPPDISKWNGRTFQGFHRADGQVGTRNYWIVLPLVFCENRNLAVLKQAFEEELGFAAPQIFRRQVAELAKLYHDGKKDSIRDYTFQKSASQNAAPKLFPNVDGIKFL